MSPQRREDSEVTISGQQTCWYVQDRYLNRAPSRSAEAVRANLRSWELYAEHPIYFDSLAEAQADVRRQRKWPTGSGERYVDVCSQEYWWVDGAKKFGVPVLIDSVPDNYANVYGFHSRKEYEPSDEEIAAWTGLKPGARFARLKQQIIKTFDGRHDVPALTSADNAQQLPEEKEMSAEQAQAIVDAKNRQLAALSSWIPEQDRLV